MIHIKAPGRICLFGEHQDYLNFPVIAMAISRYIDIVAEPIDEQIFAINMPDVKREEVISIGDKELGYNYTRDYLRSGINQFVRKGIHFHQGYKITIKGNIPINAGASSSSALVTGWLYFLSKVSNSNLSKNELAEIGYHTEVAEFGEAGGKMDFYSSSLGKFIWLDPNNDNQIERIDLDLNGFVLGDSLEKKSTVDDLKRVKNLALASFSKMKQLMPKFNRFITSHDEIKNYLPHLSDKYRKILIGNINNRDITYKARNLFNDYFKRHQEKSLNSKDISDFKIQLGNLLNMHHQNLRDNVQISTPKIDLMLEKALEAGALGGKINGSGFGGTMFVFAPNTQKKVAEAIENAGGKAYLINTSDGVKLV